MKSIRLKWFSLMITLFLAFGTVFSVATATLSEAKAYDADVEIRLDDQTFEVGEITCFEVDAYSETGFSSYQLTIDVPSFLYVRAIRTDLYGDENEGNFEWHQGGQNRYNVNYTSTTNEKGKIALFFVDVRVNENTQGQAGTLWVNDALFTDTAVNRLSVETDSAFFRVNGEFARMKGDFNGDGAVTIEDVMLMQRIIADRSMSVMKDELYAGDIDNNGVIDIYDCQYVRNYLIGLIDSLDNIGGGENPHGDENIFGEYVCNTDDGTLTLTLNNEKSYRLYDDEGTEKFGSFKCVEKNVVCLVSGYSLTVVSIDIESHTFIPLTTANFSEADTTAEGYTGTYRVNGSTEDTVNVAANGAFIRTCIEDGCQVQYNGMIGIREVYEEKGAALGVAYVFGIDESSAAMTMPFTLDMRNKVIYVEDGGHGDEPQDEYEFTFEIVDTVLGNSDYYYQSYPAGMSYSELYNDFITRYGAELSRKFNGIAFDNPVTESGKPVNDNSIVDSSDKITLSFETKLDPSRLYYSVDTVRIRQKGDQTFEENYNIQLYYGCTASDVANAIDGEDAFVYQWYRETEHSSSTVGNRERIKLSASMLGDLSKINFNDYSSRYVELPVNVTYGGNTVSATLQVMLVPNMTGASVVKDCVVAEDRAGTSYMFMRIYDNGWLATCSYGAQDLEDTSWYYTHYVAEEFNGKTVYIVNHGGPDEAWAMSGEQYEGYDILYYMLPAEDDTTTVYYLSMFGMNAKFYVFGEVYAAMYVVYGENEELNGTCKVLIENGKFHYYSMVFDIDENNNLVSDTSEDEPPIVTFMFQGADMRLYADGTAKIFMGDIMYGTTTWTANDDYSIIYLDMSEFGGSAEMPVYKWTIDDNYHALTELDWDSVTSYRLMYVKDGKTTVYTLYNDASYGIYLFNNETRNIQEMQSYTAGLLSYYSNPMTGESTYYYYNTVSGILYDVVRYELVGADGNHFGYAYLNDDNDILYGHWIMDNNSVSGLEATFVFNAENNTYVVNNNGTWLFTATPVMATSIREDNKLVVSDYAGKTNNGSDGSGVVVDKYDITLLVVVDGRVKGEPSKISVSTFEEFGNIVGKFDGKDDMEIVGVYFDINKKEDVTPENFRSGSVYVFLEPKA